MKEKMNLGTFVRVVASTILKSDAGDISVVDTKNLLSKNERIEIKNEIEFFRLIILMFQLSEISRFGKKKFSSQELGQVFGIGVGLAYQDNGLSRDETEKKMDILSERIGYYTDAVEKTDQKELEAKGVFFYLIKYFTNLIIKFDVAKLREQQFQDKHFLVFELGKQVYRHDEKAFKNLIKNVKFLDE